MNFPLPPLRRKVLKQIIKIVFLFGLLNFTLIFIIQASISSPKSYINQSNNNTSEILKMLNIVDTIYISNKTKILPVQKDLQKKFLISLETYKKNNQYEDSSHSVHQLEEIWEKYILISKNSLKYEEYIKIKNLLKTLITENQENTLKIINNQILFSKRMAWWAWAVFALGFGASIYFSEKLSASIAQPLKRITEVLQNKPGFNGKLKFPQPTSLEIKVLIMELNELWKHLAEQNDKSEKLLQAQRKEMETIFSAMEDVVMVIDSKNCIQHYNHGLLDILGIQDKSLIHLQKWDDLSIGTDSYLQLRSILRKGSNNDEALFTCKINEEDKIYRMRKKILFDSANHKHGIILLLHDITKKLPENIFKETLNLLKIHKYEG